MTTQRQAAVVLKAVAGKSPRQAGAAAIRAAVELVLPEDPGQSEYVNQRMIKRAKFLAIADAMEAPTDA